MSTEAGGKRVSVAIKAQFYWGDQDEHGLGLVTAFTPGFAYVHASAVPPTGARIRLKLPMAGKAGSVELWGQVVALEGAKLQGFGVQIAQFVKGENALADLLGMPRDSMIASGLAAPQFLEAAPAAAPAKEPGEVTVRIGVNRAEEPGFLVDLGETGLYLRTRPGPDGEWQLRQGVRTELSVPMGQGVTRIPMAGRIVRIDPPDKKASDDPSWGLAVQFREGTALSPEMAKRIQLYLPKTEGESGIGAALWTAEGFETPGTGLGAGSRSDGTLRRGVWTKTTFALAILMVIVWAAAIWWLTEWRFQSLLGPPPDPATLPKPP